MLIGLFPFIRAILFGATHFLTHAHLLPWNPKVARSLFSLPWQQMEGALFRGWFKGNGRKPRGNLEVAPLFEEIARKQIA